MKRTLLAIAAAAALVVVAVPSTASAQRWGHGGWHHFGGPRISFSFGVRRPYYRDYAYDYGYACRVHRIWTPYGWRWRRWC